MSDYVDHHECTVFVIVPYELVFPRGNEKKGERERRSMTKVRGPFSFALDDFPISSLVHAGGRKSVPEGVYELLEVV